MDLKNQRNLMLSEGTEVYQDPSPLHAVALQGPTDPWGGDPAPPGTQGVQGPSETRSANIQRKQTGHNEFLWVSRVQIQAETLQTHKDQHQDSVQFSETSQKDSSGPGQTSKTAPAQRDQNRPREQVTKNRIQTLTVRPPQGPPWSSGPSAVGGSSCEQVWSSSLKRTKGAQESVQVSTCEVQKDHNPPKRRVQRPRPGLNHRSRSEDTHVVPPQFVHAEFVPAGSQKIQVRPADQKPRALKLRRPQAALQQHPEKTRSKGDQRRPGREKLTQKYSGCPPEELRPGPGPDSGPCSPGLSNNHKIHNKLLWAGGSSTGPQGLDYSRTTDLRRRRGGADLIQTSCPQQLRPSQVQVQESPRTEPCAGPGLWTGPPHFLQSTVSLTSFHPGPGPGLKTRFPPAPCSRSSLVPPEDAVDCPFHSTAARSGEGELSNDSNCFGDSESSWSSQTSSGTSSSLSLDREDQEDQDHRDLVLVQAGLPKVSQHRPPACRIKASRALKKKIRRFQPDSLKVMTLV